MSASGFFIQNENFATLLCGDEEIKKYYVCDMAIGSRNGIILSGSEMGVSEFSDLLTEKIRKIPGFEEVCIGHDHTMYDGIVELVSSYVENKKDLELRSPVETAISTGEIKKVVEEEVEVRKEKSVGLHTSVKEIQDFVLSRYRHRYGDEYERVGVNFKEVSESISLVAEKFATDCGLAVKIICPNEISLKDAMLEVSKNAEEGFYPILVSFPMDFMDSFDSRPVNMDMLIKECGMEQTDTPHFLKIYLASRKLASNGIPARLSWGTLLNFTSVSNGQIKKYMQSGIDGIEVKVAEGYRDGSAMVNETFAVVPYINFIDSNPSQYIPVIFAGMTGIMKSIKEHGLREAIIKSGTYDAVKAIARFASEKYTQWYENISNLSNTVNECRNSMGAAIDNLRDAKMSARRYAKACTVFASAQTLERFTKDIRDIPFARSILVNNDTLSVVTEPLFFMDERTLRWHQLGVLKVSIKLQDTGENASIKDVHIENLSLEVMGYATGFPANGHPHTFQNRNPCWGRSHIDAISSLLADMELSTVFQVACNWILTVNLEDSAGARCNRWPEAPIDFVPPAWHPHAHKFVPPGQRKEKIKDSLTIHRHLEKSSAITFPEGYCHPSRCNLEQKNNH